MSEDYPDLEKPYRTHQERIEHEARLKNKHNVQAIGDHKGYFMEVTCDNRRDFLNVYSYYQETGKTPSLLIERSEEDFDTTLDGRVIRGIHHMKPRLVGVRLRIFRTKRI